MMQDRPTLMELLDAVRGFIADEVVPATKDQRMRFRARVAANVLAVAARECELGDVLLREEVERLRRIPGGDERPGEGEALEGEVGRRNADLARRIREGTIDAAPGGAVWDHLRRAAVERLRIANPELLERTGKG